MTVSMAGGSLSGTLRLLRTLTEQNRACPPVDGGYTAYKKVIAGSGELRMLRVRVNDIITMRAVSTAALATAADRP